MREQRAGSAPARFLLWTIAVYQSARTNQPSPCRFSPSCSEYAKSAIETRGFLQGSRLAVWRILRCNPFGGHGLDLLPETSGVEK